MISFTVNKRENGKRIDRILVSRYNLGRNTVFKALRNKDIKVNGKRVCDNIALSEGDVIAAYLAEDSGKDSTAMYTELYSDDDMLVVSKKQGISVDKDAYDEESLIEAIRTAYGERYLLCHRLDRNTGGILLIAKNESSRNRLVGMMENKEITKKYMCIVYGKIMLDNDYTEERAWHFKDKTKSTVYISDTKKKHYKEIITRYRSVSYNAENHTSLLEVIIDTGRTHQIRAHMAHLGYPLIGDGKYGSNDINRLFNYKYQALWSSEIIFGNGLKIKDKPMFE